MTEIVLVFTVATVLYVLGYRADHVALTLLSIVAACLIIQALLWLRRSRWKEFGMARPRSWIRSFLLALGGVVAIHVLVGVFLNDMVVKLTKQPLDIRHFDALRGNLPALLGGLVVVWILAAFGEEMIFRGFLLNRISSLFKKEKAGMVVAVLISSIVFGLGHLYQGLSGVILTGVVGLIYSLFYLLGQRNLWTPILIHGIYDTSAFLVIYFNLDQTLAAFQ